MVAKTKVAAIVEETDCLELSMVVYGGSSSGVEVDVYIGFLCRSN